MGSDDLVSQLSEVPGLSSNTGDMDEVKTESVVFDSFGSPGITEYGGESLDPELIGGNRVRIGNYETRLTTSQAPTMKASGPKKLSHRLKFVAQLSAMGVSQREIAERTGYTEGRLSIVLNSPLVSVEVDRARRSIFEKDPEVALRTMLPMALESVHEVLANKSEKSSLRVETAFKVFERTHGKAKQQIDVGGNLLKDLFEMMDKRDEILAQREKDIVVESKELGNIVDVDPLDVFIQENFKSESECSRE